MGLEKKCSNKRIINSLHLEHNVITSNPNKILQEISCFYQKLYTSNNQSLRTKILNNVDMPQISQEDKEFLDSPIRSEEIKIVIKQLGRNKCPGLDGLPIEFYDNFYKELMPTLNQLVLKMSTTNTLNYSARQGTIALLDKLNKDLLEIKNW